MHYVSTRGKTDAKKFSQILLSGLADDGGLYMPEDIPFIEKQTQIDLSYLEYKDLASFIFSLFAGDSLEKSLIQDSAEAAYTKFNHKAIAPLKQMESNLWMLELFHGPTVAFKDYAMQLLGEVIERVLAQNKKSITIICATSGDTGAAAANAFANRKNIRLIILHPNDRVSPVQRKQMTTLAADNVINYAVEGSFDDCQDLVKEVFSDQDLVKSLNLTGVNSINWARICAQIVYYVYSSLRIGSASNPVNFVVPTGNFGNIFAGYMAKKMGFPIAHLTQSSNENDVLPRFFNSGSMELKGVHQTISPSMDIQISSNFERFLYLLKNKDTEQVQQCQDSLKSNGSYQVSKAELSTANELISAVRCGKSQAIDEIIKTYEQTTEILCPHTATAVFAAREQLQSRAKVEKYNAPTIAVATAHPAKFQQPIHEALGFEADYPQALQDVLNKEEVFTIIKNDIVALKKLIVK